jgi:poly(3-hydroxybutyrate) depolymerase
MAALATRLRSRDTAHRGSRRTTLLPELAAAVAVVLTVALLPIGSEGDAQTVHYDPGTTTRNRMESAGKRRQVLVHVPASYHPGDAVPLVLNFHGYESSAAQQEEISEMSVLSESEGFIVAYPDGLGRPQAWQTGLAGIGAEDRVFVRDLVNLLRDQLGVDAKRIYAMGFSNGAQMANRLMCEMEDVFASIANVSGGGRRRTPVILPGPSPSSPFTARPIRRSPCRTTRSETGWQAGP